MKQELSDNVGINQQVCVWNLRLKSLSMDDVDNNNN